ncbi:hypothetical protein GEMRC1_004374 [Eukaryota sp. GEM-RC1]
MFDPTRDPLIRQFLSRYGKSEWSSILKLLVKFSIGTLTSSHPVATLSSAELQELADDALSSSPFAPQPCPVHYSKADASWREDAPSQLKSSNESKPSASIIEPSAKPSTTVPSVHQPSLKKKIIHKKPTKPIRSTRPTSTSFQIPSTTYKPPSSNLHPDSMSVSSLSQAVEQLSKSKWISAFGSETHPDQDDSFTNLEPSSQSSVSSGLPRRTVSKSHHPFDWLYDDGQRESQQRSVYSVQTPHSFNPPLDDSSVLSSRPLPEESDDFVDI